MQIACLSVLLLASASACRLPYLFQLGVGQARTLKAREPLDASQLSEDELRGLETLRAALAFGSSLGLEESSSYRHLIERTQDTRVWVVVAAPADRLEPETWWFPITGRISYLGFFGQDRAERFGAGLERRGLDVYVREAALYSTLGFFDDPIPRAMLSWEPHEVAETILHELVHESVFVRGDLDYNEGLATFVGREATLRLFADRPEVALRARQGFEDADRFAALLAALADELEQLYSEIDDPQSARGARAPILRRYQEREYAAIDWQTQRYVGFASAELSNAYLLARRTYLGELPCFALELEALAGDLAAFVAGHRARPGHRLARCDTGP